MAYGMMPGSANSRPQTILDAAPVAAPRNRQPGAPSDHHRDWSRCFRGWRVVGATTWLLAVLLVGCSPAAPAPSNTVAPAATTPPAPAKPAGAASPAASPATGPSVS